MIEAVRRDLERGLKNPGTGRDGLTPSQVLRSFVLKSVKSWDLRELRERIADGYTLRQFTEFYCQPVPKHHAFNRAFHRLTPETVKAINELVVNAAVDRGLEDGNTLRVDCTVVQTDVHHPTDKYLVMGCRTRGHSFGRRPQKSSPAAHSGVPQSQAGGTTFQRMTPRQRHERQTEKNW